MKRAASSWYLPFFLPFRDIQVSSMLHALHAKEAADLQQAILLHTVLPGPPVHHRRLRPMHAIVIRACRNSASTLPSSNALLYGTVPAFMQMMNWDWERNRPSTMPDTIEAATQQGW